MGEVYRALDPRLSREVAIKVLPERYAADLETRQRFEQEARAASALNHPNIVTVYDIGVAREGTYIAMELVSGRNLRELLTGTPLPFKKLLDVAVQAADGLAKAHGVGIVHRDLKPENLMVTDDGLVKILDFGLAKLSPSMHANEQDDTTPNILTGPGKLVGTVGYMSPEQATEQPVDHRSDQFALGAMLYEMATGRRAFYKRSAVETLNAIINDDPPPAGTVNPAIPAPLRWIVERCLSKDKNERYASTWDLARELRHLRDHLSEISSVHEPSPLVAAAARARSRSAWLTTALVALALAAAALLLARGRAAPPPVFQRITFRRGWIASARFGPDGHGVVYGAAWQGRPVEVVSARLGDPESRTLFGPADLLAISPQGEMAIQLEPRYALGETVMGGTLARASIAGGAARPLLDDVQQADWSPDGRELAIVRDVAGKSRLEYPIGTVLRETDGWLSCPRVSPSGGEVAFLEHPIRGDDAGSVLVAARGGGVKTLSSGWSGLHGLAWRRAPAEVWVTGAKSGFTRVLHAISPAGRERLVLSVPETLTLHDIAADGRVLLTDDLSELGIAGVPPGDSRQRSFGWFDFSAAMDISPDGETILFEEAGDASEKPGVYVRKTDGSAAVRLGDGAARALSPDRRWVLSVSAGAKPRQLFLLPTGAGEPRAVTHDGIDHAFATWFPDGRRVLFVGREAGVPRLYVQDVSGGPARAVAPPGVTIDGHSLSPDGARFAAVDPDGAVSIYPVAGGAADRVRGVEKREVPIRWSADGRSIFVFRRGELPGRIVRVDLESGRREVVSELVPADPTGILSVSHPQITPDGRAWVYTYNRTVSTLFVVTGLARS